MAVSPLITVTPPVSEPVSLDRAKLALRVEHAAEDQHIAGLIAAARLAVEGATGRRLMRQTVRATWDRFPAFDPAGWVAGPNGGGRWGGGVWNPHAKALRLPGGPCAAVDAVRYYDAADVLQTLTPGADYLASLDHVPGLVYPAPGTVWPVTRYSRLGCVSVQYQVGYATPADVPEDLVNALLDVMAHRYRQRGDAKDFSPDGLPPSAHWVIDHYRLPEYR